MSDEHIKVLRAERDQWQASLAPYSSAAYREVTERKIAALDAAIAALGGVEPIGYASANALHALTVCKNDKFNGFVEVWLRPDEAYTIPVYALPAPPSKEG